jgi:RNA-directed DNA polymerase
MKQPRMTWKQLRRRYYGKDRIQARGVVLYNPVSMRVMRYRFRGAQISTPWNQDTLDPRGAPHRLTGHDDPAFLGYLQEALT